MSAESLYSSRWSFSDTSTFGGSSVRWDFNPGDSMKKVQRWLRARGLGQSRAPVNANFRRGQAAYAGSLPIDPSPKFLGWALPRLLGGGTETAPALANEPTEFYMLADRGTGTTSALGLCYKYGPCMINRLTLNCRGGLMDCALDLVALGRSTASFAGAALGTTLAYAPYEHADNVITLQGDTAPMLDYTLIFENNISVRYNTGSNEPQAFIIGQRRTSFAGSATFDANFSLPNPSQDAATIVITNGAVSTAFSFAQMNIDDEDITTGDGEFIIPITAEASGTTAAAFTIANDVTP